MNVYGQLIAAQLENLSSDPTGVVGRAVYRTDTTFLKVYNGTTWKSYVDDSTAQTLSSKTLGAGNILTGSTIVTFIGGSGATITAPSATGTLATLSGTEAFTNKTLNNTNTVTLKDTLFILQDDGDVTKQARFQLSGITTGTTRTFTLPDADGTLITSATAAFSDSQFTLQDDGDATKQARFQLSGITTGTTRTYTLPNASDTIAVLGQTQNFTGSITFGPVTGEARVDIAAITSSDTGRLIVSSGNGTASARQSYIVTLSSETSPQRFDFGLLGTKDWQLFDNTAGKTALLAKAATGEVTLGFTTGIGGSTFPGCHIVGKQDGVAIVAGYVGEHIASSTPSGTLVNNTAKTLASISLTPGVWLVYGSITLASNTAVITNIIASTSLTDNTDDSQYRSMFSGSTTSNMGLPSPCRYVRVSATTSVYLVVTVAFTGTAPSANNGILGAVRVA